MIYENDSVKVYLAKGTILPVDFISFTPKEQSLMIQIGYDTFIKTKSEVYENFTDKKKKIIKEELDVIYKNEIEQLKNEIKSQQESMNILKNTYEKFIQMKNDSHKKELEVSERKNSVKIRDQEEHDFYKNTETPFRKIVLKSFRDFNEFELLEINEHFVLKFKEFSVLVHSYNSVLNNDWKDKLKEDLLVHSNCTFGWFVSMDMNIENFDRTPFMFEWLSTPKCICYINSLLNSDSPVETIRNVYFTCQTIFKIMNTEHIDELNSIKKNEIHIQKTIRKMIQNTNEREKIMSQFRVNLEQQDSYILDMLNKETNQIVHKEICVDQKYPYIDRVVDWWNFHIVEENGSILRSAIIWTMFKRDNPDLIGKIDAIEFKNILYSFIPEEQIIKPRNKAGALEIQNIRWKVDRTMNVSK